MAELKTKQNNTSVTAFLKSIEDETKRKDCQTLLAMMKKITGKTPKMWGDSIVGFGKCQYTYPPESNGWFITGFSPRKQNLSIHIMNGFGRYTDLMKKLGKHKTGQSCLYVKKLNDIDHEVLYQLIEQSVNYLMEKYECK